MNKVICDVCKYEDAVDRYGKIDLCSECLSEITSDCEVKKSASEVIDSIQLNIRERIEYEVSKINVDELFDRIGSFKEVYYKDLCCVVRSLAVQAVKNDMESIVKVAKDEVREMVCGYVSKDKDFKDYVKSCLENEVEYQCQDIVKEIYS